MLPVLYLLYSLSRGRVAGPNPWYATGPEWQTPSPPPTSNFLTTPVVTYPAYEYVPHVAHEMPEVA